MWEGPISVAAFAPHTDAGSILQVVNQLCYCLPDMSRVSLHLVFMKNLPPDLHNSDFSRPANCNVPDVEKIATFRSEYRDVAYPINVCRNAARVSADTKHILVSGTNKSIILRVVQTKCFRRHPAAAQRETSEQIRRNVGQVSHINKRKLKISIRSACFRSRVLRGSS